eukprot:TRINITY_DN43983_c0_g1_i1.p1 TRINITY_DN43983_c0_g1~~TRINITY_DN43983_c0_g1_i1.p1  ORF type:complete len:484 (-),score=72.03 TRINITY_DN43983_c0_g1_i1:655-2106(-)
MRLVALASFFVAVVAGGRLDVSLRHHLDRVSSILKATDDMHKDLRSQGLGDMPVKCALCGVAVNEVLGLLLENRSVTDVEAEMKAFCNRLPSHLSADCNSFVGYLPVAISFIEHKYTPSGVCTELNFCVKPFASHADPSPVRTFHINLDLPPSQRFREVCSDPVFRENAQYLVSAGEGLLGQDAGMALEAAGTFLNDYYFPTEYAEEIRGCSAMLGVPYGWLAMLNLGYEVSDACTSLVAAAPDGTLIHARNLDFWMGMGFTDTLKNLSYTAIFERSDGLRYTTGQLAGFVGVLSGQRIGQYSVTVNTRFYPGGITQLFDEVVRAIEERNASLVTFLVRDVLAREADYASAVASLGTAELIADVYYTVAGVSAARNEGTTLARNRTHTRYAWPLDVANGVWYTGVSNYDRTGPNSQPWYDDRWDPACEAMNAMGRNNTSVANMFQVVSTKPVLNLQSTYTTMSVPARKMWTTQTRWCPYPCVQ